LVSVPLVVEQTHDCWNDMGVYASMENARFNSVVFVTNGFGYEREGDDGEPVELGLSSAIGGRVGYMPREFMEVGSSVASLFNKQNQSDMMLAGVDLQMNYRQFSCKGEYIYKQTGQAANDRQHCQGFYVQGLQRFGSIFLVSRYDNFTPEQTTQTKLSRVCFGAGWVIRDGVELRDEFQINNDGNPNAMLVQLVVGF
jgi:hypothetical protein